MGQNGTRSNGASRSNGTPLPSNQIEAISDYTLVTRYARYDHKNRRRETWPEMVERVRDMHLQRYGVKGVDKEIKLAFDKVLEKKILPSMRSLQFGGEAILANDARMYNCAYTLADRDKFFSEMLWMLLSGVGVGFSVQKQHVEKLPELITEDDPIDKPVFPYIIEDTIEGWSDALHVMIRSYFKGTAISGREVFFDFTKIRRKGSWLKVSGGRAPGAKPLQIALKKIRRVLKDAIENEQNKLKPIQVYDIAMLAADCVLSGGIRRSATIALFSPDDEEMMKAKTFCEKGRVLSKKHKDGSWITDFGKAINLKKFDEKGNESEPEPGDEIDIYWYNIYPWRARSNNSVALLRKKCTAEQFKDIINNARAYGEPGFVFLENLDHGYNPCVEIGLNPVEPKMKNTGWQTCNLTEINGGAIKTKEDFKEAVKCATIIGTLQAGYTYFHYLTDTTREIIRRESLLGVSVTGWMDNPSLLLDPEIQREMAEYAISVNKKFARKLGIPSAARVTCTKPAGSTSLVLGTGSGIHPHHSRRYFRRMMVNSIDRTLQYLKIFNPQSVEKSLWGTNDEVITFCIEVPDTAILKEDLGAVEFLKIVKKTYENWVLPGNAKKRSSPGLTHNVSNTVQIADDEWDEVADYIYENRECFSGISLIPKKGDKIYPQAPMEKVETHEDVSRWNTLVSGWKDIDWSKFNEQEDFTNHSDIIACAGGSCDLPQ